MPDLQNIVTFQAPHYFDGDDLADPAYGASSLDWIFDAEFRLSEFLATGLTSSGFEVGPAIREFKITSVVHEVRVNGRRLAVCVSYDRFAGDWAISVNSRLFLWPLRGKTNLAAAETLCRAIDEVLRKDQRIKEINWQTSDERRKHWKNLEG